MVRRLSAQGGSMSVRDKPCHFRKDRANGPGALCGSRRAELWLTTARKDVSCNRCRGYLGLPKLRTDYEMARDFRRALRA